MCKLAETCGKVKDMAASEASESRLRLAYLVNQYPKVSHSFIRREILALEQLGWQIFRVSIRGWEAELADPEDIIERGRTVFVLKSGAPKLLLATIAIAIHCPYRFFAVLTLSIRMMQPSDRPFIWHLIYLAEACWIVPQLR